MHLNENTCKVHLKYSRLTGTATRTATSFAAHTAALTAAHTAAHTATRTATHTATHPATQTAFEVLTSFYGLYQRYINSHVSINVCI